MSDTTPEQLAALDRAATQGVWESREVPGQAGWSQIHAPENPCIAVEVNDEDGPFIVALVNAYRTGKLVLIGPDAVERVARALCEENAAAKGVYRDVEADWPAFERFARAALTALGVK